MNPPTAAYPKTPKGSELRSINIRKVENGFVASCSYIKVKESKKDMCCPWEPDKEYALTDRDSVHKFVDEALGIEPEEKKPAKRFGNTV